MQLSGGASAPSILMNPAKVKAGKTFPGYRTSKRCLAPCRTRPSTGQSPLRGQSPPIQESSNWSVVRRSDSLTRSQSLNQSPFLAGQSSSAGWGTPTVSHQIGHITPGHNLPNNHSSAGQRSSADLWSISTGLQSLNRSKSSKRSEYFISSNKRVLLQVSVLGFCGPS